MKTITIIIAAIFALQANFLFADNDAVPASSAPAVSLSSLAPSTPAVATFEEFNPSRPDAGAILPVVFQVSGSSQSSPVPGLDPGILDPVMPGEAYFSDVVVQSPDVRSLAPGTPGVADFE